MFRNEEYKEAIDMLKKTLNLSCRIIVKRRLLNMRILFLFLIIASFCIPCYSETDTEIKPYVPPDVLAKIKHTLKMRPNDKSTLDDHVWAYYYLQHRKPSNIPDRVVKDIRRSIKQQCPNNYVMQKELYVKKALAYYKSHNLKPAEDDDMMKLEKAAVEAKELLKEIDKITEEAKTRPEKIIQTFKGPFDKTTELFEVKHSWLLWYHTKSDWNFTVEVYDDNGKYIDLAANTYTVNKRGVGFYKKGGKYYLEIESEGNWDVRIIEMEIEDGKTAKSPSSYIKNGGTKLLKHQRVVSP